MKKLTNFNEFLNETLSVNNDVKKLTNIIYDAVVNNIESLRVNGVLIFKNLLQDNYKDLIIFNDTLIFKSSNNFQAGITKQENKNNIIILLEIVFNVDFKKDLNKLKQIINHELTHVIENVYSKELSKDWDIYQKFKIHQKKYENCLFWIDISNLFYDTLSNELRSRTSETYEILKSKNTKDIIELKKLILSSPEYKKLKDIIDLNPMDILKIMKIKYKNYDDILSDFMENVFDRKFTDENFIKLFNNIKFKVKKQIKKLFRLISHILYESYGYIEEYNPNTNINYSDYIKENLKD